MAYLKPIKDRKGLIRYYSRITSVNWLKELLIPLNATSKTTARVRHAMVEKVEPDIKKGMQFKFPWQSDDGGKTKVILLTIGKCLHQWLNIKATNTSPETHRTYLSSLKGFINALKRGEDSPIRKIKTQDIENYKSIQLDKGRSPNGINKDLRGVLCFFNWSKEEKHISDMPKVVMLKEPHKKPKYINEKYWNMIMELESLSDWWKNVFSLYRSTGMRRSESIHGYLDGEFLIVSAEHTKGNKEYEIHLQPWQIVIVKKIHEARDEHLAKGSKMVTFKNKFTKTFKDACDEIGSDANFHCLRHTFAVMRYLETRDIYQVCKELNHGKLDVTEIYTKFSFRRLEQDFPSLINADIYANRVNNNKEYSPHMSCHSPL